VETKKEVSIVSKETLKQQKKDSQLGLEDVLIIDDDPLLRDFLASLLRKFSIQSITHAGSTNRACELMERQHFQLVFLDIQLKNENGLENLPKMIKVSPDSDFVVVSALSSIENAQMAMQRGARGFIAKPFTIKKLEGLLNTLNIATRG
jgi:DNA-binding NtrC family response regulator